MSVFVMGVRACLRRVPVLPVALALALPMAAAPARADSCWMHNGSLMRLIARGSGRVFAYESPRPELRQAGVSRGTVLFTGDNINNWYSGTARVFSSACPGNPLEYRVEGPVAPGQTRVTLRGTREVHANCRPTGRRVSDTLVFTYSHRC